MSNHGHVLVENEGTKRAVEELLSGRDPGPYVDVDDVEYLVYFVRSYTNEEKIENIFSDTITYPYAHKVVRVITELGLNRSLLPINDTLSVTMRAEEVLTKVASRNIQVAGLGEVRAYLLQHIDLIDILPFVSRIASETFDPETELSLELYRDPEVEDSYLAFLGRNLEYDEKFFEKMKIIRSGYTDLLTDKSGWILVTTDFDSPHQGE
jgi:hypothetical protein